MSVGGAVRSFVVLVALVAAALLSWPYFDPTWHEEKFLERKPYPMQRVDLQFPQEKSGVQYYGRMVIHVYIDRDGATDRVEVTNAGVPMAFIDAAVKAFKATQWEPGVKWGRRVKTLKVVEVDFEPPVTGLTSPNVSPTIQ